MTSAGAVPQNATEGYTPNGNWEPNFGDPANHHQLQFNFLNPAAQNQEMFFNPTNGLAFDWATYHTQQEVFHQVHGVTKFYTNSTRLIYAITIIIALF